LTIGKCRAPIILTKSFAVLEIVMLRLWPFAPAFVVLLGAIIVADGSFWAGFRQSNFNAEIRTKNEQIATSQQENIRILKGSDFFHFLVSLSPNTDGKFPLMSLNRSDLPVYDVYLNIRSHVDLPFDTPAHQAEAMHYILNPDRVELGTVPPGAKQTNVFLAPGYYQIDIRTRYAKYTEMLKFGPFGGTMGQSYIISDYTGETFEKQTSPDGFPKYITIRNLSEPKVTFVGEIFRLA
jgi:hypothetical protein